MNMKEKNNVVIGQSGGPTAAINATLAGIIKGCLTNEAFGTVYGMKNGIEGLLKKDVLALAPFFEDESAYERLKQTPAAALGSCRMKLDSEEKCGAVFAVLDEFDIGYFFYIGGNDSMDTVAKLEKYQNTYRADAEKIAFIGVPKTIDNDLCCTDHTPGYGSAAKFVACAVAEIARDCRVYTQKAVTVIEIMGRDAGWLAASAALAADITGDGADLVYLPEIPFDNEAFLNDVRGKLENPDKPYVVVAVSEGVRNADGEYAAKSAMSGKTDIFGHAYLAGTGKFLENLVRENIGCKCRSVELNVLQRCASHIASATDIDESFAIGYRAAEAARDGASGVMMCFERVQTTDGSYQAEIRHKDIAMAANLVKRVPSEYITPDGKGISRKGIEYIKPLIAGERDILYANGLPVSFSFDEK